MSDDREGAQHQKEPRTPGTIIPTPSRGYIHTHTNIHTHVHVNGERVEVEVGTDVAFFEHFFVEVLG